MYRIRVWRNILQPSPPCFYSTGCADRSSQEFCSTVRNDSIGTLRRPGHEIYSDHLACRIRDLILRRLQARLEDTYLTDKIVVTPIERAKINGFFNDPYQPFFCEHITTSGRFSSAFCTVLVVTTRRAAPERRPRARTLGLPQVNTNFSLNRGSSSRSRSNSFVKSLFLLFGGSDNK